MTLPASGAISMSQVRTELGASGAISLGQASVRALAGVASGAISLNNLRGKANAFNATISSSQTNLNLRNWAIANGWNGSSAAVITINSGVYIYSTSIANAGLTIDGSWPAGVTLINNGYIMGMGGRGGYVSALSTADNNAVAENGGNAISLGVSCAITNNSYIAGGGGGGGTARLNTTGGVQIIMGGGGGGAGGGVGGTGYRTGIVQGPAGGAIGSNGSSSTTAAGASGGRVLPGTGGAGGVFSATSNIDSPGAGGGAGGGGSFSRATTGFAQCTQMGGGPALVGMGAGGGGGGWGAAGGTGIEKVECIAFVGSQNAGAGGAGGATGANATYSQPPGRSKAGGTGGKAVALNGFAVTWNAVGTRYGAVS